MAGKLKTYDVTYNGQSTTMKLTEADAKRLGATEVGVKKRTAANKSRTTSDTKNVCAECGFEAKSAGGLTAHQRSHGG